VKLDTFVNLSLAFKSTVEQLISSKKDKLNAATLRAQRVNGKPIETVSASDISRSALCGLLTFSVLIFPHARASESMPPRLYEVTTETVMPHLEENLRYATTRGKRCLDHQQLSSAFPILSHESLKGCRLDNDSRDDETVSYLLICEDGNVTTGTALWHLGAGSIRGTLDVKLGGKNMTFYQRITAKPLGECVSEGK
jgi:hypothetical protein